jgi:hypothetical protein
VDEDELRHAIDTEFGLRCAATIDDAAQRFSGRSRLRLGH